LARVGRAGNRNDTGLETAGEEFTLAFAAPVRHDIPPVGNLTWVRNPIDSFVLAKLESEKIAPSKEADRNTLIRRLSLDLIGLPQHRTKLTNFFRTIALMLMSAWWTGCWRPSLWRKMGTPLARPGALRRQRWLRKGYAPALRMAIRQWVIDALNQNMPFDEFTIEQLAGDLLPHATLDQKVATVFFATP